MTKTFCDFCETYIPNPNSFNSWYLPVWEEGVVSKELCLCDTCVQDMATITDRYKKSRKRERF